MDYAILGLIALCLGAGVAGGVLSAWGAHRRLLALEVNLQVILDGHDNRIKQLSDMVIRGQKRDAAATRWTKKDLEDEATIKALTTAGPEAAGHPWDPRTWGMSK